MKRKISAGKIPSELSASSKPPSEKQNTFSPPDEKVIHSVISDSIRDAVITLDHDGRITFWNKAAREIFGYSNEEIIGKNLHYTLAPEKFRHDSDKAFSRFRVNGEGNAIGRTIELTGLHKNGRELPIELSLSAFKSGGKYCSVGVVRDITERKRSDNLIMELNESLEEKVKIRTADLWKANESLKLAQEAGNSGAWDWNMVDNTFFWSEEFLKLFGMDHSTVPGLEAWAKSMHPDDAVRAGETMQYAIENKIPLLNEYRIILPDKSVKWIRAVGKTIYDGDKPLRMIGICIDITDIKDKMQELETMYHYQRVAGESALFGIWRYDVENKNLVWSPEVKAIHEVPDDFVPVVEKAIQFYAPEFREKISNLFSDCILKGIPFDDVMQIITSSGKRVWVKAIGEALKDHNGRITDVLGSFQNIDSLKKMEDELINAKLEAEIANKAKSDFLLNISHEFRTPLNAVIGYTDMLENAEGASRKEYAESIRSSGRRLQAMVDDILDLLRSEKAEIELEYDYIDIKNLFREIERTFTDRIKEKSLKFVTEIPYKIPSLILADGKRLRQVISNLIDNAVKYTDKGEVCMRVRISESTGNNREKTDLQIEIADTGKGMTEEFRKRIFEVFSQAEKKTVLSGIGIGLALSQRIVMKMNGTINVVSHIGSGSSFIITLRDVTFRDSARAESETKEIESEIEETDASKEDIIDIQGLINNLEGSFLKRCETFMIRQPIGEVKSFGKELVDLGTRHNCILISEYGLRLVAAADNFDIEGMLKLIKIYNQNIETLRS